MPLHKFVRLLREAATGRKCLSAPYPSGTAEVSKDEARALASR